jgi:carboxyl-terminal processing protease
VWTSLLLLTPLADAGVPGSAYARAVDLVDSLYLYPDRVDAVSMLHAAAEHLAGEVDWLLVTPVEDGVDLRHGSGRPIGAVTVGAVATLPEALAALEDTVRESGYPVGDLDVRAVLLEGMCHALDRYSTLLVGDRRERFDVRLRGTVVGIGAELDPVDGDALRIETLLHGGPAEIAGVRPGDALLRIDGRSTVGLTNAAARKLLSGEEGTQVVLGLDRAGAALDFAVTRAEVVVPNVAWRVLPGDIGYVAIDHVSQRTVVNLVAALDALGADGALDKGLVIDVRGNTGGSMRESAFVADHFVESGLLLETVGRDGREVPNLQPRIDAVDSGTEPHVPIAILVDDRTASGSEILAGALLELDRAVLIGSRTYGKGTVQKSFDLDNVGDTKLKLTVAEYVLAGERHIADAGLVPDATIGEIVLDEAGVRYRGWEPWWQGVSWEDIVPAVVERPSWRGIDPGEHDVALELARRVVASARDDSRTAGLAALGPAVTAVRAEEEQRLQEALLAHGIDWTPASSDGGVPEAEVRVSAVARGGDRWQVTAVVDNAGSTPLNRAQVELSGPGWWSGLVVPIGAVPPGQAVSGAVTLEVPPGIEPRDDIVGIRLRAHRRPPLDAGEVALRSGSPPIPRVALRARLVPITPTAARAEVTVRNLTQVGLTGLDGHFAYPADASIELENAGATIDALGPLKSHRFEIGLALGDPAPSVLPLEFQLESEVFGELADWSLPLPRDGTEVVLEAPTIQVRQPVLVAPTGSFTLPVMVVDDREVDHAVVWVNGRKTAWVAGGATQISFDARVALVNGPNRITINAVDDQGLPVHRTFSVRGEDSPDPAVDAAP